MPSMSKILGRKMDFTDDHITTGNRMQYTSFEAGRAAGSHGAPSLMALGMTANGNPGGDGKAPLTIQTKPHKLDADKVVSFYGRKHFLSNFFDSPFLIAGHVYPSVEHYYEACKVYAIAGPYQAMYMKNVGDPGQVKAMSKKLISAAGKSRKVVEQWKRSDGILVVRVGLMEKFRQNPMLREKLLGTDESLLVQCNKFDNLWAVGMDGFAFGKWMKEHEGDVIEVPQNIDQFSLKSVPQIANGKNLLGFVLMQVREALRSEYGSLSLVKNMDTLNLKKENGEESGKKAEDSDKKDDA